MMKWNNFSVLCLACISFTIGGQTGFAFQENNEQQLIEKYSNILSELKSDISQRLPELTDQQLSTYNAAREAEKAAVNQLEAAQKQMGEIATAKALVGHAKGKWIGGADKGIAEAKAKLEKATTDDERSFAQQELEKWEKNREDGVAALNERQANLDRLEKEQPKFEKALEDANLALTEAKTAALKAVASLQLDTFLNSDQLDSQLAKFVIISEVTPEGLANFGSQSQEHEALIQRLLSDQELMRKMVVADGAEEGRYGEAMKIYSAIQKASERAGEGVLQRLALAISLEHAVPVQQRNPEARTDDPAIIDPVKRYFHYESAFLKGELDPGFKDITTWDLRMVVNGNEPDEILAWGREMLRNYRPDHICTDDYRWRYVAVVRTDCKYGSQDNKYDQPELQFFQNILMNGGVCGRRAFFGRFILRSFGVPTTARPQRGHAALAHWTPDGWVVCLGGGWGAGWANGPNNLPSQKNRKGRHSDLDFLATTQARSAGSEFMMVKRAQWIGDVMGEKWTPGFETAEPEFWYSLSYYHQRNLIEKTKAVTLAAVGEELGEANESNVKYPFESPAVTDDDLKISVGESGVITIPAVACTKPTRSTGKIIFMPSNLGGKQLHYSRTGKPEPFEYTFDAPTAGKYRLTAQVVTPSWRQQLRVNVNDLETPVDIALPFTVGDWEQTEPVEVILNKGQNVLRFSRQEPVKGITIKDFTLSPVE